VTLGVAAEVEVEAAVGPGGPAAGGECGVVGNWYVQQARNQTMTEFVSSPLVIVSLGMVSN
jgi:hypothetical protein